MKKYVVVDIDGTIAKSHARQEKILKLLTEIPIEEMPWDELFADCADDDPIKAIIDLVVVLDYHYHIVFCTSRNIEHRDKTREWMSNNIDLWKAPLLMRKSKHDHRSDTIVKPELLEEAGITPENTAFILEDKNTTVEKWRELGFTVLQPANNDY
jgi:hypothetical protein